MKINRLAMPLLFGVAILAGCASTQFTNQTPLAAGLRKPNRIWVYDFVASPSDAPADSPLAQQASASSTSMTPEQIQTGRKLGALIAEKLAADITAMGIPAIHAGPGSVPQVGDGVLRGYLISTESGNAMKRFVIGFGSGTSEMSAAVEGYAVTPTGLRKVGSGTLDSSGSKTPGVVMPAALAIATGNPLGLAVMGGMKLYGEASGKNSLDGRATATADAIAAQLKIRFQQRGWISQ